MQTGTGGVKPLIKPALRAPLTLSFWNVVELFVLAAMRRRHRLSMRKVRRALDFVRKQLAVKRPLLTEQFLTDGVSLFVERYAQLIDVGAEGQLAFRRLLAESLRRIERDSDGLAIRLYPWLNEPSEPLWVQLDPRRAFGRLVLADTGVPTESIAQRFRAGDSVTLLMEDYHLSREQIETALRWEQSAPRAA